MRPFTHTSQHLAKLHNATGETAQRALKRVQAHSVTKPHASSPLQHCSSLTDGHSPMHEKPESNPFFFSLATPDSPATEIVSSSWAKDPALAKRTPLSETGKAVVELNLPKKSTDQAESAAQLLRATALWYCEPKLQVNDNEGKTIENQNSYSSPLCRLKGFRYPKTGRDQMREGGEGLFAIVWRKGYPFRVELQSIDGVLSLGVIRAQLSEILEWSPTQNDESSFNLAVMSQQLGREQWASILELLKRVPGNSRKISWLYSSAITMALEDDFTPHSESHLENNPAPVGPNINSFADQILGSVVYANGHIELTFDRTATDYSDIWELSRLLRNIIRDENQYHSTSPNTTPGRREPIQFDFSFHKYLIKMPGGA